VVDFGLAKILGDNKTYTLCGTPDYLAPEMVLNEGHTLVVDFWAYGVLLYEFVAGVPPFYADDPMETYEKIMLKDYKVGTIATTTTTTTTTTSTWPEKWRRRRRRRRKREEEEEGGKRREVEGVPPLRW